MIFLCWIGYELWGSVFVDDFMIWVCGFVFEFGGFWHFTLNFLKNWQYVPICKLYRSVPLFRHSITLKSSSIKYSIYRKSSYARSKLKKKKKIAWNSSFRKSSSMQKIFYKCNHPIFKELYSGDFKPYCDVLKPYSGVFLQIFFCECNRPISREPYSSIFKPYSDVLKPYRGVLKLNFLKIEFHAFLLLSFFFLKFYWA